MSGVSVGGGVNAEDKIETKNIFFYHNFFNEASKKQDCWTEKKNEKEARRWCS